MTRLPPPVVRLPGRFSASLPARLPTQRPPFLPAGPAVDPLEQMAIDDRDDWVTLRLVVCIAVATLLLALASSFVR